MKGIERVAPHQVACVETLVFAGGGNRCWWQAGVVDHLLASGWRMPSQLVGASAGAGIAASCLGHGPRAALEACARLFAANTRMLDRRALARLKLRFVHEEMYPAWIGTLMNASTFDAIARSPARLRVALTRPARMLGLTGSVVAGTLAYLVDKYLWNSLHPRLPRLLGLRQEFVEMQHCGSLSVAQNLLIASAAAPPVMAARRVTGTAAIDGGYTDNAPIPAQSAVEKAATLVLLTRHYPALPALFRWRERMYWQPSRRVPVSTWECTTRTTLREAFALGALDAAAIDWRP